MKKFIELLHQVFDETELKELVPSQKLLDIEEWDSIIVLSVIDLADRHYSKTISGEDIARCVTIEDLHKLITV